MFDDFFAKAHELSRRGEPFATATVVRAEKPTSGKPGDKAIVTLDGVMVGWIGGSCAQPTVVLEAQKAIADGQSRLIRLSPDPEGEPSVDGLHIVPMTCYSGGTLDVYIEPQQPRPHLIVVGHLPAAQALAHLGRAMNYRVTAVVPDREAAAMDNADAVVANLSTLDATANPLTYIVIATHGHDDEYALGQALATGAPYVGLIASPKRGAQLRQVLANRGLSDEVLARLKAPAGLDIGARRGDEIALSILAEIVEHRRHTESLPWPAPGNEATPEARSSAAASPETAIDPICGMTVVIEGARHLHEHDDQTYYFCCDGCRARFSENPSY